VDYDRKIVPRKEMRGQWVALLLRVFLIPQIPEAFIALKQLKLRCKTMSFRW
jgi:hypothetical protein